MKKEKCSLGLLRDEAGAAIIEFALVAPLLLALVWGIIESGRAFYTINSLGSAVRDGARYAAAECRLGPPPLVSVASDSVCYNGIKDIVSTAFQPLGPPIDRDSVRSSVVGANRIRVEATYGYQPISPVAGWRLTITRAAVFRYERLP